MARWDILYQDMPCDWPHTNARETSQSMLFGLHAHADPTRAMSHAAFPPMSSHVHIHPLRPAGLFAPTCDKPGGSRRYCLPSPHRPKLATENPKVHPHVQTKDSPLHTDTCPTLNNVDAHLLSSMSNGLPYNKGMAVDQTNLGTIPHRHPFLRRLTTDTAPPGAPPCCKLPDMQHPLPRVLFKEAWVLRPAHVPPSRGRRSDQPLGGRWRSSG